jgi:hypothetical protein
MWEPLATIRRPLRDLVERLRFLARGFPGAFQWVVSEKRPLKLIEMATNARRIRFQTRGEGDLFERIQSSR